MNRNIENIVCVDSASILLNQQDIFEKDNLIQEKRELPLHIYLICKSPKILLDVKKSSISEDSILLNFYSNVMGQRSDYCFKASNGGQADIAYLECDYPFNYYKAFLEDGTVFSEGKTHLLMKSLIGVNQYEDVLDLEVLYVGQAFGKDGKRITFDRLKTHEKAQQIYFDTQNKFPDEEVWFVSVTFEQSFLTVLDPKTYYKPDQFEDDLAHLGKVQNTPISFDQQITVLEACLIRYFNTYKYNKEYLNFPSKEHKSYKDIYDLDFNGVSFSINTKVVNTKLFSKDVESKFIHSERFFLHNDTERKEVLKWLKED